MSFGLRCQDKRGYDHEVIQVAAGRVRVRLTTSPWSYWLLPCEFPIWQVVETAVGHTYPTRQEAEHMVSLFQFIHPESSN